MKVCYKCGEYKKVRKIIDFDGKYLYVPNPFTEIGSSAYWYDYMCEDCYKARKILRKEKFIEEQKVWIKKRDKILRKVKNEE